MRDRLLEALRRGEPVEVDSATLMIALMHAKLDHRRFAFGGVDADKVFRLDEHDRLVELPDAGCGQVQGLVRVPAAIRQ